MTIKTVAHPDLVPTITPIEQCPRHEPGTGTCWQRDTLMQITRDWGKLSRHMGWYDYEPGFLVDGGVPIPATTRLRKELPLIHRYGVRAVYTQVQASAVNCGPNFYLRARLYWDVNADVDAILHDYFAKLYGPAAGSVRAWWDELEKMMHAPEGGHQHEDEIIKCIYPIEKVRALEQHVRRAEVSAEGAEEAVRKRVQGVRFAFENLVAYLEMRQAEDDGDFAQAAELGRRLLAMRKQIREVDIYLYNVGDLDRPHEDGNHQTGGWIRQNDGRAACIDGTAGDLVAMLPDRWRFMADPENRGVSEQWFDPATGVSAWKTLRTTRIWEVQGLEDGAGRGYDGIGWYRIETAVPATFKGRPLKLNFGGVYGKVNVWVNGRFSGYRPFGIPWWKNGYNRSFDIDVSDAVDPGRLNTIVVRVDNGNEWGGIYRRVFLWSPREE